MISKIQRWEDPPWYSSYEENNYGDLFYALVRVYKPEKVVELGTKAGYSAYHIEGGSTERDRIDWMIKYKRKKC